MLSMMVLRIHFIYNVHHLQQLNVQLRHLQALHKIQVTCLLLMCALHNLVVKMDIVSIPFVLLYNMFGLCIVQLATHIDDQASVGEGEDNVPVKTTEPSTE